MQSVKEDGLKLQTQLIEKALVPIHDAFCRFTSSDHWADSRRSSSSLSHPRSPTGQPDPLDASIKMVWTQYSFSPEQQGLQSQGLWWPGWRRQAGLSEQVDLRMDQRLSSRSRSAELAKTRSATAGRATAPSASRPCPPPIHQGFDHLRITQHFMSMLVRAADHASHRTQQVAPADFPAAIAAVSPRLAVTTQPTL